SPDVGEGLRALAFEVGRGLAVLAGANLAGDEQELRRLDPGDLRILPKRLAQAVGVENLDVGHCSLHFSPPTIPPLEAHAMNDTPRGALTVRIPAMPADTNANGDIFGGWVLSRMDQAGGIAGVERAKGRVVTIAVDAMTFIRPVRVGDVLEVYTEVESVG